jgi:hypothetical protein
MTVYDLRTLQHTLQASVQQFRASATNIVMNDQANVVLELQLKGESFTLNGQMSILGGITDWRYTNAPGLRYFTNYGSLSVANEAHFGDDAPQPYMAFVNRGTIQSAGQDISSDYVELGGTNVSISSLDIFALDGKVDNGRLITGGDIAIWTGTLKLQNALFNSGNRIHLTVTNALFDNGPLSGNTLIARDGFFLHTKPSGVAFSDLLGTTFQSSAPNFAAVGHLWAAQDYGPNNSGFSNNVAIGRLVLSPEGFDPFFAFTGTGLGNGLYVDHLDLSQLNDYANQLQIDPNIVIYYAAASLSFTPPNNQTPEEYLDGQFGGHLRWVRTFAGPNSSVDVLVNGNQTIQVNRALRNSRLIDSDSDGVPNFFDLSPFDGLMIAIQPQASPAGYQISWIAAPQTAYRVEYRTDFAGGPWSILLQTTNTASVSQPWSVLDTNVSGGQRQYRVTYNINGP